MTTKLEQTQLPPLQSLNTTVSSGTLTLNSCTTIGTPLGTGAISGGSPYQYALNLDDTLLTGAANYAQNNQLSVRGNMSVDGDIIMNDLSLRDRLDRIEQQLGILQHRPDWEQRVEELKLIGDQYRAMVDRLDEKQRMWDILSGERES